MVQFEDRSVTGDLIAGMAEADRWFEVVSKPYYEEVETKEGEVRRKLAIPIKFHDGRLGVYYPNRTSCRAMDKIANTIDMDDWVGKKFYWGRVLDMNVFGEVKKVPYVTSAYPVVEKAK